MVVRPLLGILIIMGIQANASERNLLTFVVNETDTLYLTCQDVVSIDTLNSVLEVHANFTNIIKNIPVPQMQLFRCNSENKWEEVGLAVARSAERRHHNNSLFYYFENHIVINGPLWKKWSCTNI